MKNTILLLGLIIILSTPVFATESGTWMLPQARQQYNQGNYNKALQITNDIVSSIENDIETYKLRSSIKEKLNDIHGAINDLNAAIELEPKNSNLYEKRANLYCKNGEYSLAIKDFINITEKNMSIENYKKTVTALENLAENPNVDFINKIIIYRNLTSIYNSKIYNDASTRKILYAMRLVQNVTKAPITETFTEEQKNEMLTMVNDEFNNHKGTDALLNSMQGLLVGLKEYALGNKGKALQIIAGAKEETIKRTSIEEKNEMNKWIDDLVGRTIKSLDKWEKIPTVPSEKEKEIGVSFDTIGSDLVITKVFENSSANNSGLQVNDKVLKINLKSVSKMTMKEVFEELKGVEGTYVTLSIQRGFEKLEIKVKREFDSNLNSVDKSTPDNNIGIGIQIKKQNVYQSSPYTIIHVIQNSPADKAGLQINDKIISINGKDIIYYDSSKKSQIQQLIKESKDGIARIVVARGKINFKTYEYKIPLCLIPLTNYEQLENSYLNL